MIKIDRLAKVEAPYLVLCVWKTPECDIKISLSGIERIDRRGQVVQRKNNGTI